jgi:geranylgeranyl reductase family protein
MISDNCYDVAVIGSGPAGSIAAQKLSSNGLRVILFEKDNLPRYKTCGGGIVKRAIQLLPADISSVFEKEFYEINIIDQQADFRYKLKRNSPIVYTTMRKDFDYKILENAKSCGTSVLSNCEVYDLSTNNETVHLKTTKGEFNSSFVIGADGVQGISLKKSGLKINKKNLPAVECEIYVSDSDLERFSEVKFDFGFISGGYAWIFPKKDHLSVGLGAFSLKRGSINLNSSLKNYIRQLNFNKIINIEKHGYSVPVSSAKNILANKRILITGDAAALVDPLTAEGITPALLSGKLASEAIIEGGIEPDFVQDLYNKKIEKYFHSELEVSLLLNKIFYYYPALRIFLIKKYGIKFCEIIADVISGNKRYSELLKNPLNYFKLVKYYFNPVRDLRASRVN